MKSSFWHRWLRTNFGERPARRAAGGGSPRRVLSLQTMEDRSLPSGMPQLLQDASVTTRSSSPTELVTIGTSVFFSASDGVHDYALYRSDGTPAGTQLVKDIPANNLADVNGTLYFASGASLWKSDGTPAGTVLVKTIYSGNGRSPTDLTNVDGTLYFTAASFDVGGHGGRELWKSDGTAAGTVLVKDINPGNFGSYPDSLTNVNGVLYFAAADATHGTDLWRSDGTAAGTTMVKDINPGSAQTFAAYVTEVNGTLFFRASDGVHGLELWKSDGTAAGTVMLKDIYTGVGDSLPRRLTNVNGTLFFEATGYPSGSELWKSDGTAAGTTLVKDADPGNLTNVNGTLFFFIGDELWKSNGSAAGTVRVVGGLFNRPWENGYDTLPVANGILYFRAYTLNSTSDSDLWKSDGTAAGTVRVKDINPGSAGSYPSQFATANGTLFFAARDGLHGTELWKSDGTTAGTSLVKDINPISTVGPGHASEFTTVGSTTYFVTEDDGYYGLWKSDGTTAGTTLVKDLSASGGFYPRYLTDFNGMLYFGAGNQLWKSDGTAAGTTAVADITVSSELTKVNGTLLFAGNFWGEVELWRSDGTTAGTNLVKDVDPSGVVGTYGFYPNSSNPHNLTNANGTLYFTAHNENGFELWKSDGTTEGTVLIEDIGPGSAGSYPTNLTTIGDTLYFSADDGTHGSELWQTDGTAAGTTLIKDINPGGAGANPAGLTTWNGLLFFATSDGTNGAELWQTDGTAAGTTMVKDINPGGAGANPSGLTTWNGLLYFAASDGTHGSELWRTDGTAAGTALVKDINAGSAGSNPASLTNGGALYFAANNGTSGVELWETDGTSAGTVRVMDINPGAAGSNPANLTVGDNALFFRADDGVHGPEPWVLAFGPDGPPAITIADVSRAEGNFGTSAAQFTVQLSAPSTEPVSVQYSTANGTATAGSDYQATSGTLTFAPGETSKSITVPVVGDRLGESNEMFVVNLTAPVNATIADGEGVATIADDEPRLQVNDRSAGEGNAGQTAFVFTVTLSAAYDAPVTVNWVTNQGSATAGSDYLAAGGTLTFAPGETTRTMSVSILGDLSVEPDETFTVLLGNPNGALVVDGIGVGTIVNDDIFVPSISINDVSKSEGRNGYTLFVFTVTLSAPSTLPVTVRYRTTDGTAQAGSDYEAASGTLTFAPGETTKTITIRVKGDRAREGNETFTLNLSGATNAEILDGTGLGTILNDD